MHGGEVSFHSRLLGEEAGMSVDPDKISLGKRFQ